MDPTSIIDTIDVFIYAYYAWLLSVYILVARAVLLFSFLNAVEMAFCAKFQRLTMKTRLIIIMKKENERR